MLDSRLERWLRYWVNSGRCVNASLRLRMRTSVSGERADSCTENRLVGSTALTALRPLKMLVNEVRAEEKEGEVGRCSEACTDCACANGCVVDGWVGAEEKNPNTRRLLEGETASVGGVEESELE